MRLPHDGAAETHIGQVAVVLALVHEPLAVQVHHDAERVAVLLEIIADGAVPVGRGGDVPADGMAAGPVAVRPCAGLQRHADAVAGIVAGAAHPAEVPAVPEIARPHLGIGFEAAAGQHHGAGLQRLIAFGRAQSEPADLPSVVLDEAGCTGLVADLDADRLGPAQQEVHQPGAAADGLDVHTSVEDLATVHLIGLAAEHRDETHAVLPQPRHGRARVVDQRPGEVLLGLVARHLHQRFVEELPVMGGQVDARLLRFRQVGQHIGADILQPVMDEAEAAGGEEGVAAPLLLRGFFEHDHAGTLLPRRNCRAKRRIAAADDRDIPCRHGVLSPRVRSSFSLPAGPSQSRGRRSCRPGSSSRRRSRP